MYVLTEEEMAELRRKIEDECKNLRKILTPLQFESLMCGLHTIRLEYLERLHELLGEPVSDKIRLLYKILVDNAKRRGLASYIEKNPFDAPK